MKTTSKVQLITVLGAMLFFTSFANAQVIISDDNSTIGNSSAVLDIISGSGDKGLLIPRVSIPSLLAAAPVSSPATGLLVYNTNGTTGPGFFYWDGGQWKALSGSIGSESDPIFTSWDKDYADLTNKPTIPTVPANVSAFTNDAGYLTTYSETDPIFTAWDKDYDDLINKPSILNSQWTTTGSDIYYNTGKVGIGTTTPGYKLTIDGAGTSNTAVLGVNVTGDATFNWASSAIAPNLSTGNNLIHMIGKAESEYNCGYVGFHFNESGNSDNYLTFGLHSHDNLLNITGAGNVGIGTTNPTYKLEVNGNIKAPHYGLDATAYFQTQIIDGSTEDIVIACDANDFFFYERESDFYQFNIGGDAKLRIQANGNVGIGTMTPTAKLHIAGNNLANALLLENTSADLGRNYILFKTQNAEQGYIGLGSASSNDMFVAAYGETNCVNFETNQNIRMRILPSGYVGIGTTSPDAPLHVNGSVVMNAGARYFNGGTGLITNTTNFNVSIHASNDILANGSIVATSDKRVKENITDVQNSLDLISKLRPVSYNKIDRVSYGNRLNYGFIAQEVEGIIPEAVNTGTGEIPVLKPFESVEFEEGVSYTILVKNGDDIKEQKYTTKDPKPVGEIIVKSKTVNDFKSITYDMIFTVAVDAIQEQQAQIEDLKKQLDELSKIVNDLKK